MLSGQRQLADQIGTALYRKESIELVKQAYKNGYTYFDAAQQYGNSESIGTALKELGVKREDVYILTKCTLILDVQVM